MSGPDPRNGAAFGRFPPPGTGAGDPYAPTESIEPPQVSAYQFPMSSMAAPVQSVQVVGQTWKPAQEDYGAAQLLKEPRETVTEYQLDILPPVIEGDEEGTYGPGFRTKGGYAEIPNLDSELAPPVPNLSEPPPAFGGQNYVSAGGRAGLQPILPAPAPPVPGLRHYDVDKPTCSLNLVCYRSGQEGCKLEQVQCTLRLKFPSEAAFRMAISEKPRLVHTDAQFFCEMRRLFRTEMSSLFRRYFSLKTHKGFRILAYTPTSRPTVVPFDGFILQEMMYAYRNPGRVSSTEDWIEWVFRLRRADRRHAVEFVEGWDSTRIAVAGGFPFVSSCLVGIVWTAVGGDPQTTFTVASFILTSSSIILAILAIISSIESSGNNIM